MRRRELISAGMAASAALLTTREAKAQTRVEQAARGMKSPIIKDISVIQVSPQTVRLVIVKVTTDQDGLYWLWLRRVHPARRSDPHCGGKISQAAAGGPSRRPDRGHVAALLQFFLLAQQRRAEQCDQRRRPGAVGHQGPPGRAAGLSVAGRQGASGRRLLRPCVSGSEIKEVIDQAKQHIKNGFRHVRVQVGVPGMAGYGAGPSKTQRIPALHDAPVFEREGYIRRALALFEAAARNWAWRSSCCTTPMSASRPPRR